MQIKHKLIGSFLAIALVSSLTAWLSMRPVFTELSDEAVPDLLSVERVQFLARIVDGYSVVLV